MRKLIVIIMLLVAGAVLAGMKNDPGGFRGVKWSEKVAGRAGYVRVERSGALIFYRKRGDRKRIGGAKVFDIVYMEYKKKFQGVMIRTKGIINGNALIAAFKAQYGPGTQPNKYLKAHYWFGKNGNVSLDCNAVTDVCVAMIQSNAVVALEAADKKAAARSSGKDF